MHLNRHSIVLFLKGMAMGAADSVPGVSGGTVALITNIYEELVDAIRNLGWHVLVVWRREGFAAAWQYINGRFLLTLGAGILTSLLLLGNLVITLMDTALPYLLAFFAGLVLASMRYVARGVQVWQARRLALFAVGALFAMALAFLPLREGDGGLVYYFFCGAIAICAMILPGISGAFILLLLGAYAPVLEALTGFDLPVILVFAAGCLTGLMLFSRLLSWLLHHYHEDTLAALTGMLAGSLYLLWPWRVPVITRDPVGVIQYRHALPDTYEQMMGQGFSPWVCLGLAALGMVLVFLLETVAGKNRTEPPSNP